MLSQRAQFLDSDPVERERQITIKARAARMRWRDHAILTSAKQSIGIEEALDGIIQLLPSPSGLFNQPLQALVFDSYFDPYRGVVLFFRVMNGMLRKGDSIIPMSSSISTTAAVTATATVSDSVNPTTSDFSHTDLLSSAMHPSFQSSTNSKMNMNVNIDKNSSFVVDGLGFLQPHEVGQEVLGPGDIGYVTAAIRQIGDIPVGDTITHTGAERASEALPGYEDAKPLVFCGLFPTGGTEFGALRSALDKLQLTDGSVWYEPEKSSALGSGFRCGFLGLLHMAVTQERLEKEYGLDLIASTPSVSYNVLAEDAESWTHVSNPGDVPDGRVKIEEPVARVDVMCQQNHVGAMIELAMSRRGQIENQKVLGLDRIKLTFILPLAEIVTDFHDQLKSRSGGFASMYYDVTHMRGDKLVRLDILVAGERVDGLSSVVHEDRVQKDGRVIVDRLKQSIPRQMFKIAIQAVVASKVVASAHIQPFRKDVTAKCYGGDASRK